MSTTSTSSLSAGVQDLYNQGFLPSSASSGLLQGASSSQISQLANSSIASQEVDAMFGLTSDTSSLSTTALGTLTTDPLTAAVDNSILAPGTAAANQFLPQSSTTTGSTINVLA